MRRHNSHTEEYTIFWMKMMSPSPRDMSTPPVTQQMVPQGAFSHQNTSSSHQSASRINLNSSLSTSIPLLNPACDLTLEAFLLRQSPSYPTSDSSKERKQTFSQTSSWTHQHKRPHLIEALIRPPSPRKHINHSRYLHATLNGTVAPFRKPLMQEANEASCN